MKVIYLYMCTVLVCFLFAGTYTYIDQCYSNEIFDQKTSIEKQLYVRYCSDPLTLNPFDSYSSKLEKFVMYICWVLGAWNLVDLLLLMGIKNIPSSKPEDCLMWNVINSKTYKCIVRKIKKRKKLCQKNQNQNQNQKNTKEK